MTNPLASLAVFAPVDQHYLLQARQMQALSFAVHIPLVCFGIAFPAMVLFVEWLVSAHRRRALPDARAALAQVMVALFAVGVITGTILSFEMGLLWPNFTATFGSVFGLGFAIEGFSFFLEAIFIGIYVYGWDRLSPRAHLLSGIPIVITGFTGSLMVIAVNAWMNHPGGFRAARRRGASTSTRSRRCSATRYLWHELVHMYIAGYIVTGFVVAGVLRVRAAARALGPLRAHRAGDPADDRRAGVAGAGAGRRLGRARRGARRSRPSWRRSRGWPDHARRARCTSSAGTPTARSSTGSGSRSCSRCWPSTTRTRRVQGLDAVPADRAPAGQRRARRLPDDGRDRHAARAARGRLSGRVGPAQATARVALVLPRARRSPGPLSVVALIAGWVVDRGRPPAVGRLPRDADRRRRSPAPAASRSATRRSPRVYLVVALRRRLGPAAAGARAARAAHPHAEPADWRRREPMLL